MAETEMMAYLDFTTAGNERVEAVVREMMAAEGYRTQYRRGLFGNLQKKMALHKRRSTGVSGG
ncbi:hypothetical protein E4U52_001772 [Claviceps spartinae]|nr:hypothetical protein E4U52_001772 [Claviceps spartinae]